jgi:hypothetical protein
VDCIIGGVDLYGISLSKYPSASIELFGKMVILLQVLMTASLSLFLVNSFSLIDKQRNVRNQGVVKAAFCKYLTSCSSCRWYTKLSNMLVPINAGICWLYLLSGTTSITC